MAFWEPRVLYLNAKRIGYLSVDEKIRRGEQKFDYLLTCKEISKNEEAMTLYPLLIDDGETEERAAALGLKVVKVYQNEGFTLWRVEEP